MATKVMLSVLKCQNLLRIPSLKVTTTFDYTRNNKVTKICTRRYASWFVSDKGVQEAPEEVEAQEERDPEDEAAIEAKRDVSRLPVRVRGRLEHSLSMPEQKLEFQTTPRHERYFYAYYGRASGIDVNVAWPNGEELAEMKEFEQDWEPSLQERWAKLKEEKEEEIEKRRLHEQNVEKAMAKMPEYIEQFKLRLAKQELVAQNQEEKRKELMEEARDYFGYDIDPRDPRFKEMQERKAEEEQKMKRKKRKEQKELKMEAALERLRSEGATLKKAEGTS